MRKKITDKLNTGTVIGAIILLVCVYMLTQQFPLCRSIIERAAIFSSKTVLVGAQAKQSEKSQPGHTNETAQGETKEKETTEALTEKQTEETTGKTKPEGEPKQVSAPADSFTDDPADIKKLMEEYGKKAKKDKKDGDITSITFTTSGATDSFQNVRVKNVNETDINIEKLMSRKADFEISDKSEPSVLIFHTHTTESYQILDRDFYARGYLSRTENSSRNMIRVGDEICTQLEKAGYSVIHDTNIYDKQYNGAYQRSRVTVEEYLKKYPSIQITLDIHRDAIQYNDGTKAKIVNEIKGKKCAQMMIISGCQEQGNGIEGFPDWEYNLVFALHLQKKLEDMYPGIMRPLYFCPRRYNMNVNHCSLLVEVGTDANTLSEGVYAGRCLGTALASLMDEYVT